MVYLQQQQQTDEEVAARQVDQMAGGRGYLSSLFMRMQPPMMSLSSGTLTLEKLSGLIP